MQDQTELRRKALKALEKKAAYGDDFELKNYQVTSEHMSNYDSLEEIDDETKQTLLNVGVIPSGKERSGTLIMTDNSISHSSLSEDSVELTSTRKARDKYKWFDDYFWKLVPVDKDKYTAKSYLENADGYFIRAPANTKTSMPVQTCLMLGSKNIS
ncbi:SufD family Fe-S cluster assembly protein, partial [Methanosalsum natronophilum]